VNRNPSGKNGCLGGCLPVVGVIFFVAVIQVVGEKLGIPRESFAAWAFTALVFCTLLGVPAFFRWRRDRVRSSYLNRGMDLQIKTLDADPLMQAMKSIVRSHVHTLALERRRALVPDKYGVVTTERWDREVELFIDRVATPHLLASVPNRIARRSLKRMAKQAYRHVLAVDAWQIDQQIQKAVLRSVVEAEIQIHETAHPAPAGPISNYSTPNEFEEWCANELRIAGWDAVVTGQAGDQGVDVRAVRDGIVLAVQCKLYNQPVGNNAIQEVFAGRSYYRAHASAVVSTAGFTKSARAIAAQTGVYLLSPSQLRSFSLDNRPEAPDA
jgi:restriction system protein